MLNPTGDSNLEFVCVWVGPSITVHIRASALEGVFWNKRGVVLARIRNWPEIGLSRKARSKKESIDLPPGVMERETPSHDANQVWHGGKISRQSISLVHSRPQALKPQGIKVAANPTARAHRWPNTRWQTDYQPFSSRFWSSWMHRHFFLSTASLEMSQGLPPMLGPIRPP